MRRRKPRPFPPYRQERASCHPPAAQPFRLARQRIRSLQFLARSVVAPKAGSRRKRVASQSVRETTRTEDRCGLQCRRAARFAVVAIALETARKSKSVSPQAAAPVAFARKSARALRYSVLLDATRLQSVSRRRSLPS